MSRSPKIAWGRQFDLRAQHLREIEEAKSGDDRAARNLLEQIRVYLRAGFVLPKELNEYLCECLFKLCRTAGHEAAKLPEKRRKGPFARAFHLAGRTKKRRQVRDLCLAARVAQVNDETHRAIDRCVEDVAKELIEQRREEKRRQVIATYYGKPEKLKSELERLDQDEGDVEKRPDDWDSAEHTVRKAWQRYKSDGRKMAALGRKWRKRGTPEHEEARARLGLDRHLEEIDWPVVIYDEDQVE